MSVASVTLYPAAPGLENPMFHTPAHKQTDPTKLPAQRVNPVDPHGIIGHDGSVYYPASHYGCPEVDAGPPPAARVITIADYVQQLQQREASALFHAAADALVLRGGK